MTGMTFFALTGLLVGLLGVGYLAKTLGDEISAANRAHKDAFDRINTWLLKLNHRLGKLENPCSLTVTSFVEEDGRGHREITRGGPDRFADMTDMPRSGSQITSVPTSSSYIRAGEKAMAEAKREQGGGKR